jgi:dTDP-4-dehydrorhamnose 3,5-epimerase-like enzyme
MAKIIKIPTINDQTGSLSVIEKMLNFSIKRVYFIYNTKDMARGGHRHKKTKQLLICVSGSCDVFYENNKKESNTFLLDKPNKCLCIEPSDWHTMQNFSKNCVLLVLASEYYDKNDYINERY